MKLFSTVASAIFSRYVNVWELEAYFPSSVSLCPRLAGSFRAVNMRLAAALLSGEFIAIKVRKPDAHLLGNVMKRSAALIRSCLIIIDL